MDESMKLDQLCNRIRICFFFFPNIHFGERVLGNYNYKYSYGQYLTEENN